MSSKPTASVPSPPRFAGKRIVVRGILTGLLKGEWEGGARLPEVAAVERFGVSRTPVREALLELKGLGFVELRSNCGAIFLPFGPEQLAEIYSVRSLLEVEATRLATGRIAPELLDSLIDAFARIRSAGGIDPEWEYDRSLHQAIADASGNLRLSAEIARYGDVVQTVREIVGSQGQDQGLLETTAEKHLAILQALKRQDSRGAADAMKLHLAQASETAAEAAKRMRGDGFC